MSKSFDFVVKAEKVVIKEKGDNNYKVKLAGVGDFLKYQTWSSTNTNNVNGKRSVSLVNAKNWVKDNFPKKKLINPTYDELQQVFARFYPGVVLPAIPNPPNNVTSGHTFFTPTTVMEVGNKKYVFVIESATYNKDKKYNTVLNVSTTQIVKNNITKDLVKLPVNKKLNNVRLDIDSSDNVILNITGITVDGTGYETYSCTNTKLSFSYDDTTYNVPFSSLTPNENGTCTSATSADESYILSTIIHFLKNFSDTTPILTYYPVNLTIVIAATTYKGFSIPAITVALSR
jgi:hypothetical protein